MIFKFLMISLLFPSFLFAGGGQSKTKSFSVLPDLGSESWNQSDSKNRVFYAREQDRNKMQKMIEKNPVLKNGSREWYSIVGYVQRVCIVACNEYVELYRKINSSEFDKELYDKAFQEKFFTERMCALFFSSYESALHEDPEFVQIVIDRINAAMKHEENTNIRILSDEEFTGRLKESLF